MFKFYSQKYPEDSEAQLKQPTAEFIVSEGVKENAPRIFTSVISLLLKIYSAAIGNFISHHCCLGGLYLIGSLTNSLIPKIKDVEWLADFNKRHFDIELTKITPVIVCKEIDLGLKGAFFAARKILQWSSIIFTFFNQQTIQIINNRIRRWKDFAGFLASESRKA